MPKSYRSRNQRRNTILSGLVILGFVFIMATVLAGVYLVQRNQDIRQQASGGQETQPPEFFLPGGDATASPEGIADIAPESSPSPSPTDSGKEPPASPEGISVTTSPSPEPSPSPEGIDTSNPSPTPSPEQIALASPTPKPVETAPPATPLPSPEGIDTSRPSPTPKVTPSPEGIYFSSPSPSANVFGGRVSPTPLPIEVAPSPSPSGFDFKFSPTPLPIETASPLPSCTPVPSECLDVLTGKLVCTLNPNFSYCGVTGKQPPATPEGIATYATPTPEGSEAPYPGDGGKPPRFNRADINQDGYVNLIDYSILSQRFLKPITIVRADINSDGFVNLIDYAILSQEFELFTN